MIKFIKNTVIAIQILAMAFLFVHMNFTYTEEIKYSNSLKQEISTLNSNIEERYEHYTKTIIKIVENVKMTDAYLFTGGYSDEETDGFSLKSYEDMLTLNNDFTDILNDLDNFFGERTDYYNDLPNIWPLFSTSTIAVSSGFGDRFNPFTGKISLTPHNGIDLVTKYGDPVIATADGYVKDNWIMHDIYGRWVVIQHKHNISTHYAHMSKVIVHEGDWVRKGQVIGYLGNSGFSTGPHLHYGIFQNGIFKDPVLFLRHPAVLREK